MRAFVVRNAFPLSVAAVATAVLGLFFVYPLAQILGASVLDPSGTALRLANYPDVLTNRFFLQAIRNSLGVALAAAALTIAIGVPFAFCVARVPMRGKPALIALTALPLVLPSFVSAYALVLLFGRAGIVTQALRAIGIPFESIYGLGGVVTVFALTLYPYVVLPTVAAFQSVDVSVEEAAQNLGASRLRVFFTVTLPLVLPAILAGGLLVLIEGLENFGVPFVLAQDNPMLAVEAFKLFVGETAPNPAAAGVLGMVLIGCTVVALIAQRGLLSARRFATGARRSAPPIAATPRIRRLATIYCWTVITLALVPFVAVVVIAFLKFRGPVLQQGFSLDNFAQLFANAHRPLANTLMLATIAALGATAIGVPIGYLVTRTRTRIASVIDVMATAPFAVAGTVLGIGLIMAFGHGILILTGTAVIMVIAYMVRKLPFSVRAAGAILHQIDPSLEEASINLGVPPLLTFWRVTVPLMLGGIVGGLTLTFVTIASELSSTIVLYSAPWTTMTVAMFQALEGSSPGVASAAATVLIIVTIVPVALVYRLLRKYELSMM
jgi:iron(III) transport system permease protein